MSFILLTVALLLGELRSGTRIPQVNLYLGGSGDPMGNRLAHRPRIHKFVWKPVGRCRKDQRWISRAGAGTCTVS
jgi:hypothetical protein